MHPCQKVKCNNLIILRTLRFVANSTLRGKKTLRNSTIG